MDENPHSSYAMLAPGRESSGAALRCPGAREDEDVGGWPAVDDHLVDPEITRDEMVRGRLVQAQPAKEPHGERHFDLDYVVRAHIKKGWIGATDLLTRVGPGSDFATDACIRRVGTDPKTGSRYLEELAFEVVNEQSKKSITERADDLGKRGVRRIFAVFVKTGEVHEWSPGFGRWRKLDPNSEIKDKCLAGPIQVRALLRAAEADDSVADALIGKDNRVIGDRVAAAEVKAEAKGRIEGKREGLLEGELKGQAKMLLSILRSRGLAVTDAVRSRILECTDTETFNRWTDRALVIDSAAGLFENGPDMAKNAKT